MCDTEEFNSYLANLEEYVFDENRVVSIGWLSKTLQIHVSLSKKLLSTFINDADFIDKLSICWYLYGISNTDEYQKKMLLVQNEKLDSAKNKFKTITSQHVYSIQKYVDTIDLNTLYIADQSANKTIYECNDLSNIKCKDLKVIENRRNLILSQSNSSNPPSSSNSKPSESIKTNKPIETNKKSPVKNSTIGSLFNKQNVAKKEIVKKSADETKEKNNDTDLKEEEKKSSPKITVEKTSGTNKKKAVEKGSTSITSFFSKSSSLPEIKKSEPLKNKKEEKEEKSDESMDSKEHDENKKPTKPVDNVEKKSGKEIKDKKTGNEVKEKKTVKEVKEKVEIQKSKKQTKSKTNKKKDDDKKRKRIKVFSDSSDDEEEEEMIREKSLSPPPPSPPPTEVQSLDLSEDEEEVIPATPQPVQNGRRRKRKLVSKTMTDDSGFLRTVKEFETVSCSDSEPDTKEETVKQESKKPKVELSTKSSPVKSTNKKPPPKSSPSKSKQTSILSFFKKS